MTNNARGPLPRCRVAARTTRRRRIKARGIAPRPARATVNLRRARNPLGFTVISRVHELRTDFTLYRRCSRVSSIFLATPRPPEQHRHYYKPRPEYKIFRFTSALRSFPLYGAGVALSSPSNPRPDDDAIMNTEKKKVYRGVARIGAE